MLQIAVLYCSLTKHKRRVVWQALQRFFQRCEIDENVRPSFMHVSRERYETWERNGYTSRRGALIALKYLRLYKALHALTGSDEATVLWLNSVNTKLSPGAPIAWTLVHSERRLDTVLAYVESHVAGT